MPARYKETLTELLGHLGFPSTVDELPVEEGTLYLNIHTDDAGRLIGRQGQTLADLQYIANRLLHQQDATALKVSLDVGGYRAQAREALEKKTREAAEKVRRSGEIVEMEPMNGFDRWIVHNTLKNDPDIETQSVEVDGTSKKAIILRQK